jgi:hypothetical protein
VEKIPRKQEERVRLKKSVQGAGYHLDPWQQYILFSGDVSWINMFLIDNL